MGHNVKVGWTTILGWGTFAAAIIADAAIAITDSTSALHGPGAWIAVAGILSKLTTDAGRYLQSHALAKTVVSDDLIAAGEAMAALQHQAEANLGVAEANPDGVDKPPGT